LFALKNNAKGTDGENTARSVLVLEMPVENLLACHGDFYDYLLFLLGALIQRHLQGRNFLDGRRAQTQQPIHADVKRVSNAE
jgi:hypothetical protein